MILDAQFTSDGLYLVNLLERQNKDESVANSTTYLQVRDSHTYQILLEKKVGEVGEIAGPMKVSPDGHFVSFRVSPRERGSRVDTYVYEIVSK